MVLEIKVPNMVVVSSMTFHICTCTWPCRFLQKYKKITLENSRVITIYKPWLCQSYDYRFWKLGSESEFFYGHIWHNLHIYRYVIKLHHIHTVTLLLIKDLYESNNQFDYNLLYMIIVKNNIIRVWF